MPSTNQWIWIAGSNLVLQNSVYGALKSPSVTTSVGARQELAAWVDNSGTVWFFGGLGIDNVGAMGPMNDFWTLSPY